MEASQHANEPMVYLDERGFAQERPRKYGYAPGGKPCIGEHLWHAKGRLNVVGALFTSYWLTLALFPGTFNANPFYAWVAQE